MFLEICTSSSLKVAKKKNLGADLLKPHFLNVNNVTTKIGFAASVGTSYKAAAVRRT